MPEGKPSYHFDTVTLSNFALAGRLDILITRYGKRAHVSAAVLDEITAGTVAGYPLQELEDTVLAGRLKLDPPPTRKKERDMYRHLLRFLSAGEASCIARAAFSKGTVVTDDRATRGSCREYGIPFTGTIGILKGCARDGTVTVDEADAILTSMIDRGYRSPVTSISGLL